MTVLNSGSAMGGPVGHPTLLELVRVDKDAPGSNQGGPMMNSGHGNQAGVTTGGGGGGGGGYGGGRNLSVPQNRPGVWN